MGGRFEVCTVYRAGTVSARRPAGAPPIATGHSPAGVSPLRPSPPFVAAPERSTPTSRGRTRRDSCLLIRRGLATVVRTAAGGYSGSMSVIVSEVYDALIEAGASHEKARAAAGAVPVGQQLATKQDIADLKAEIAVLRFAGFTFGPLILALLVKLVFFP